MTTTTPVEGYKNFEDCDECGFVGPKPLDQSANPLHVAIDIMDAQRDLIDRLDALLEEPLTWRMTKNLRSMRLSQEKIAERCGVLIAQLIRARSRRAETAMRGRLAAVPATPIDSRTNGTGSRVPRAVSAS